jgi:hypothetical protein
MPEMTYFLRDDNGPYDAFTEMEIDAIREAMIVAINHGKEIGCLFPDDHDPRHPKDMRFRVSMRDARGNASECWEELTETEMIDRYNAGATGAMLSSTFDFWWD